ncbi:MAG: hypothetical protein ACQETH_00760 [Candidatus Rifleibacteriota bacterium]
MNKKLLASLIMGFLCFAVTGWTSPEGDLQFLGFSNEMIDEVNNVLDVENNEFVQTPENDSQKPKETKTEADYLQEQLVELANSRAITAGRKDKSEQIRNKTMKFWSKMQPANQNSPATDELRSQVLAGLRESLTLAGYRIIQLDLLDLPPEMSENKFRAVVRVTKPLKSRNSYREIQNNLKQIKEVCSNAATIEGKNYLSELTTFVAENPENKYYYEKTILRY